MALTIGTRLGAYEILSAIGSGGMGEVYRARDTKLNRDVALKVLPDSFELDVDRLTRFKREAQLLASLNHPNIAQIYGFEDSGPVHALVMELVEGPTLAEMLAGSGLSALDSGHAASPKAQSLEAKAKSKALPIPEALHIAKQIAEALEAAHEQGIIHRDLKPANIKVREDGMVKVLDFGLAKALDPTVTSTMNASMSPTLSVHATMAGVILGTAAYMSPEQAKGKPVDRRADIWAFGVVLHEMLTGKPLYSGETVAETLASVIKDTPSFEDLRPEIPQAIRNLLRRCLERDVRQRLQHIGEARIVLERPVIADVAVARPAARGKTRDRLAWAAAGLGIVLAAIGWGAFAFFRPATEVPRAVQFLVAPPDGFTWAQLTSPTGAAPSSVAVSPDGTQLALITAASGGKTQLWIRSLDTILARPLPGTDGAARPFWSPDSKFVGFFADGKLRKVPASGGPAVTLCDAPEDRGGSWNQNGVILLAARNGAPLQKVSSAGGVPSAATTLGTDEIAHRRPYFLPDGQHFLYFVLGGKAPGIHVGSLDSIEQKLLLPAVSQNAAYTQGHLLFVRETTLMAQPFDSRRLELTGEAFPIAEQIVTTNTPANGVFSASENGVLAYAAGQTVGTELVWFDRTGKEIEVLGTPAAYGYLELSPDEKRASVAIRDGTGNARDIWIFDVMRHVRTRFTSDPGDDQTTIWSPDGSRIVFNSIRKGLVFNLYQKASDGSGMDEVLLGDSANKTPTSWSPDGRSLLYRATAPGGGDLFVLPLVGERKPVPFQQTPANENFGRFSPDGRWVAFKSAESGQDEIYVAPFPGPGGKRLVSTGGGDYPRWRADGTELFYLAPDLQLMTASVNGRGNTFEVASVKPLFETRFANLNSYPYAVSGDGQRFLIDTLKGLAASAPITVVLNWTAELKK